MELSLCSSEHPLTPFREGCLHPGHLSCWRPDSSHSEKQSMGKQILFLYFHVSIYIKHNYQTYHQDLWGLFFAFMGVFNMGKAWPWLWQTPCPLPGTHLCHVWAWGIHHSGVSRTSNPSCTCALFSLQPHLPTSSSAFCTHNQPPQQFLCTAAFENHSQTSFIQASSQEP